MSIPNTSQIQSFVELQTHNSLRNDPRDHYLCNVHWQDTSPPFFLNITTPKKQYCSYCSRIATPKSIFQVDVLSKSSVRQAIERLQRMVCVKFTAAWHHSKSEERRSEIELFGDTKRPNSFFNRCKLHRLAILSLRTLCWVLRKFCLLTIQPTRSCSPKRIQDLAMRALSLHLEWARQGLYMFFDHHCKTRQNTTHTDLKVFLSIKKHCFNSLSHPTATKLSPHWISGNLFARCHCEFSLLRSGSAAKPSKGEFSVID